jgi:methyl coenzyme M reductase gamma subunit
MYWSSTKAPVHLFKREYESEEIAKHLKENSFVDPAILSAELRAPSLHAMSIRAYQRRLGVRKTADNNAARRRK